jgi:hypothetical protein
MRGPQGQRHAAPKLVASRGHPWTMEEVGMPRRRAIKQRIDDMRDAYADWVAECVSVQMAYEGWSASGNDDASTAFAVYRAALDREEQASKWFAALAT